MMIMIMVTKMVLLLDFCQSPQLLLLLLSHSCSRHGCARVYETFIMQYCDTATFTLAALLMIVVAVTLLNCIVLLALVLLRKEQGEASTRAHQTCFIHTVPAHDCFIAS